jgi:hypothetical protein
MMTCSLDGVGAGPPLELFELTEELGAFHDAYSAFLSRKVLPRYSEFRDAQSIPREIYCEAAETRLSGHVRP